MSAYFFSQICQILKSKRALLTHKKYYHEQLLLFGMFEFIYFTLLDVRKNTKKYLSPKSSSAKRRTGNFREFR